MTALPRLRHANASFVTETLLVGGDLDSFSEELARRQLAELVEVGVTHIVDVRVEWSDEGFVRELAPALSYLHLGVDDAGQLIPAEWFALGVASALEALESGGTVLVHCHMGINRGPSLGFAVLLALGWDPVDALTAIRGAREIANIAYAHDALAWFHGSKAGTAGPHLALEADLERLARWRRDHELDVVEVIRQKRDEEASRSA